MQADLLQEQHTSWLTENPGVSLLVLVKRFDVKNVIIKIVTTLQRHPNSHSPGKEFNKAHAGMYQDCQHTRVTEVGLRHSYP